MALFLLLPPLILVLLWRIVTSPERHREAVLRDPKQPWNVQMAKERESLDWYASSYRQRKP